MCTASALTVNITRSQEINLQEERKVAVAVRGMEVGTREGIKSPEEPAGKVETEVETRVLLEERGMEEETQEAVSIRRILPAVRFLAKQVKIIPHFL